MMPKYFGKCAKDFKSASVYVCALGYGYFYRKKTKKSKNMC